MPTPDLRLFGIRHHGPGSAASLRHALDEFWPDIVASFQAACQGQ